jgi:hypothetical protein
MPLSVLSSLIDRGNHPVGGPEQGAARDTLAMLKVLARDLASARRSPITDRSKWHPQGVTHVASSVISIPAMQHSILYLEGSHTTPT